MTQRYPLHIHISTLFVILILIVGGSIGWLDYQQNRNMLESTADDMVSRISRETVAAVNSLVTPAEMAVSLLSRERLTKASTFAGRMQHLAALRAALADSSALTAIYMGYGNGDFFLVRRLTDDAERRLFKAPDKTVYVVQSIERGLTPSRGRYIYLDKQLSLLRDEDHPEYVPGFDPRSRPWFRQAQAANDPVKTPPYVFFTNRKVGMTLAVRAAEGGGVLGADILLETLGETLARQKVTPATQVLLVNAQGEVIAHEDIARILRSASDSARKPVLARLDQLGVPILSRLQKVVRLLNDSKQHHHKIDVDGESWRVNLSPLALKGAEPIYLLTAIPDRELLATAQTMIERSALMTLLIIALAIPVTWLLARNISGSIRALVAEAESIRHFEFTRPIENRSLIKEVDELASTMASMKRTIQRFLDISQTVAAEDNFDRLLPRLLNETMQAASADAGVLYLADAGQIIPVLARRRTAADSAAINGEFASLAEGKSGTLLGAALLAAAARGGQLTADDIEQLQLNSLIDAENAANEGKQHAIAVPLLNRQHQTVGALLLICLAPVDQALVNFIGALSGSAAVSLEARELIKAQKALFEAFIQLIAGAIDAKSAYTGGHCARVPELAKMLAHAACKQTEGPFKDFSLDENAWEALHIAAWLHDCGKITTPDFVIDKATKLETMADRIHEVRMRFEVLKRDAEIACLKAVATGSNEVAERARLAEELAQLDDDFAFVAACNEGGEFMAPDKIARLHTIAARTWQRTLDDRIGISYEEKARKAPTPAQPLPATENLLADKPDHCLPRRPQDRIAKDNPWGFRLPVPELLYNRGELHNLEVARGTLTEEERYKINEHIIQTIVMLSQLPFPKHLRHVPELAGGHHEKMDGSGYPRGLHGKEMSPVARMMAIADIFEALTAVDRPYKKGKALSETIAIMARMKKEGHIDPNLFDLFLTSGIYRDYAERYLQPEQIDAVKITDYLG
ncbi:MAG: metal dependent phosphohydrolase [Proteobacteria bacterium]|nr:metal dependent phosphohydrolase [Pseudomonadota bacterium]